MAFKFIAALCLIAQVTAGTLDHLEYQHAQPQLVKVIPQQHASIDHAYENGHEDEHYGPAHYEFQYSVHDDHTGDIKEQKESRDGDKVVGFYTLVEPDGHKRIVHYTADKHSGFNAQVTREYVGGGHQESSHQAPVVHKVIAAPSHHEDYHGATGLSGNYASHSSHDEHLNYHH